MNSIAATKVSGNRVNRVENMSAGVGFAIFFAALAVLCFVRPEPSPKSVPLTLGTSHGLTYAYKAPITAKFEKMDVEDFREAFAHQNHSIYYSKKWHGGSPFCLTPCHEWRIWYVARDEATGILFAASRDIPWTNYLGWWTTTGLEKITTDGVTDSFFVERSAGRSYALMGFSIFIALIGAIVAAWNFGKLD